MVRTSHLLIRQTRPGAIDHTMITYVQAQPSYMYIDPAAFNYTLSERHMQWTERNCPRLDTSTVEFDRDTRILCVRIGWLPCLLDGTLGGYPAYSTVHRVVTLPTRPYIGWLPCLLDRTSGGYPAYSTVHRVVTLPTRPYIGWLPCLLDRISVVTLPTRPYIGWLPCLLDRTSGGYPAYSTVHRVVTLPI